MLYNWIFSQLYSQYKMKILKLLVKHNITLKTIAEGIEVELLYFKKDQM